MSVEEFLRKYSDVIRSDTFAIYEKELAQRISSELWKANDVRSRELRQDRIIRGVVNEVNGLIGKDSQRSFELSTSSLLVDGGESRVEFNYYGQSARTELGDLIFVISAVFNGEKYLEKITINRLEIRSAGSEKLSWRIDKGQLFLLSRFPPFRGIKGSIIPERDYVLPNYSECLGSYGLVMEKGDLAFVGAAELDSLMADGNSLNTNQLYRLSHKVEEDLTPYFPYMRGVGDFLRLIRVLDPLNKSEWTFPLNLFGNYHHAHNVFEFTRKYLTIGIGEPTFMKIGVSDSQARGFLDDLMSRIAAKGKRDGSKEVLDFVEQFRRYSYATAGGESTREEEIEPSFDGGGIGIIHTIVDLGP